MRFGPLRGNSWTILARRTAGAGRRTGRDGTAGAGLVGSYRWLARTVERVALDPRTPVLIGAGQALHRAAGLDDAREPVALMAEAVRSAAADAKLDGVPAADSVRVVSLLSWRYRDPAWFLADDLGLQPCETCYTTPGGNTPQYLVNTTSLEIQRGDLDLAILAGGESWRTRMRARRADVDLGWRKRPEDTEPGRTLGKDEPMSAPAETARGIMMPVQLYPMFETALRAAAGETVEEHQVRVSELWARFSEVAARNPYAWQQTALTPEQIRTAGPENRMIGFPYPKYMNSNNDVDMAAAVILCSVERARSLGVPEDRWVFPHAGADAHDTVVVSERADFRSSPAVAVAGREVLRLAGTGIDEVEIVDLYSCFPSAVQIGAAALGLGLDRQLTRTGGLSFAGGPWNDYVMHAIATVVGELRERPGARALVWANGGFVTKHSLGVYSTEPPAAGFRHADPQAEIDALPRRGLADPAEAAGAAVVEAYTVMHSREGEPEAAFAACLLADGRRAWGTSTDAGLCRAMIDGAWVGRAVTLTPDGTLAI
jgi:acetyl-CoA C-acetyltransferase